MCTHLYASGMQTLHESLFKRLPHGQQPRGAGAFIVGANYDRAAKALGLTGGCEVDLFANMATTDSRESAHTPLPCLGLLRSYAHSIDLLVSRLRKQCALRSLFIFALRGLRPFFGRLTVQSKQPEEASV